MNLPPIAPPDEAARAAAHARWAVCAHPLGGLGVLETVLEDIAALTGSPEISLTPRTVLVLCADNGVVAQDVTQTDSAITGVIARGLAKGTTSVCRMAAVANCRVVPVDMGVKDFEPVPGVLDRCIGSITRAFVSMERAAALKKPCIFAIGNAPTALLSLYELIMAGRLAPALVIGVPVGFVNVVESKEQIMTTPVPYIVARGRKGGSNVAAAICNAMIYQISR